MEYLLIGGGIGIAVLLAGIGISIILKAFKGE